MSESDLDAVIKRMAREEQDDLDRKHGEAIIAMAHDAKERQGSAEDPILEVLRQAHQDQAEDAQQ
jgi:putative IMPACT (imprinted ancient) family translation regulator